MAVQQCYILNSPKLLIFDGTPAQRTTFFQGTFSPAPEISLLTTCR